MTPKISIDDETFQQLRKLGEVEVEDPQHGVRLVVMTVEGREKLHELDYDDGDLSEEEMLGVLRTWLDDPEGGGAPGMEIYDELYGDKPSKQGENT